MDGKSNPVMSIANHRHRQGFCCGLELWGQCGCCGIDFSEGPLLQLIGTPKTSLTYLYFNTCILLPYYIQVFCIGIAYRARSKVSYRCFALVLYRARSDKSVSFPSQESTPCKAYKVSFKFGSPVV